MKPIDNRTIAQQLIDKWQGNGANVAEASKAYYKEHLQHGVWMVEFEKADGGFTLMECTLDPRLLPPLKEGRDPRPEQEHLIHVYSLDRAGWRSFIVANVKNFYPKPEIL
jgi:hypothetical protein